MRELNRLSKKIEYQKRVIDKAIRYERNIIDESEKRLFELNKLQKENKILRKIIVESD